MNSPKLVIAAVVVWLTTLFFGCGSSGKAPVMPLTILTSSPLSSGESNVPYNANLTASGGARSLCLERYVRHLASRPQPE